MKSIGHLNKHQSLANKKLPQSESPILWSQIISGWETQATIESHEEL